MLIPKELENLPSITVHFIINGDKSQVFFDFSKELQLKTPEEIEQFFVVNKIKQLTDEFLSVLKNCLREV